MQLRFCQNTEFSSAKEMSNKTKATCLIGIHHKLVSWQFHNCTINWIPSIPLSPYYALPWFYINQQPTLQQPDNVSGIICSCVQSMWMCYGFCHCFQGIHGQYEAEYINKGKIPLFGISLQIRFLMWRSLNADKNIELSKAYHLWSA